ncbi:MAG TPA: nuclear transport factor 2 family protein [Thermoleophilaceae bacterium]
MPHISEANVAAARRVFDLFYRGELETAEDLLAEDFEFIEAVNVPGATRFGGKGWYARLLEHLDNAWQDPPGSFEADEFIDLGDDVIIHGRLTLRGKASGLSVTNEMAVLLQFRVGRLSRAVNYPSEAAARAASERSGR